MDNEPVRKGRSQGNKGARWLKPSEKANILIEKDMRGQTKMTTADIAQKHGISKAFVDHMNENSVNAEVRKIYKRKKEKLEELAFETTVAALVKGKELIEKADNPKALSGIAAVGKMSDTVYRLETRQPTEITNTITAENHALDFIRLLMRKMDLEAALDGFSRANLDPLVPEARKLEIRRRIESGELKLLPESV